MTKNTTETGKTAEDRVIGIMLSKGFDLVCRNFRIHNVGEIDSVFTKGDTVYIVEVRARKLHPGYPTPSESVTPAKRRKISKTAGHLIYRYDLTDRNICFLIGQVTLDEAGLVQNVEFIPF